MRFGSMISAWLLLGGVSSATEAPRVLVLSALNGTVGPCGCTVDLTLGGIGRVATRIAQERAKGPTAVVVVGAHIFSPHAAAERADQDRIKARMLARSLAAIGVDAVVPAVADLTAGATFYQELAAIRAAPDVTVNVPNGKGRVSRLGALSVGFFGLADPDGGPVPGGVPGDPGAAAASAAKTLRAQGAQVIIGLGALPRRALRTLARRVKGVDFWILGVEPSEAAQASPVGGGWLIEAGDRGRNVGRLTIFEGTAPGPLSDPLGERERRRRSLKLQLRMRRDLQSRTGDPRLAEAIAKLSKALAELDARPLAATGKRFEYALLPVEKALAPDPRIAAWARDLDAAIKARNLETAGAVPPVPANGSGFAGGARCVECHEAAAAVWEKTAHAKAWRGLAAAGKTFDVECVACHVTGWRRPGGSVLTHLDGLRDVQCEACHGPGERHVQLGGEEHWTKRRTPESVCRGCHTPEHSPKFDYATWLPKILGPGHQRLD